MVKGKKAAALILAMMLTMTACGDKKKEVTDYGQVENSASSGDTEASAGDAESSTQEGSGKTLSEMLGGTQFNYKKEFDLDGRHIKVNISYEVFDTEKLSEYKVSMMTESDFNEDDIVKTILGDSAKPLNTEDRKDLGEGDSAMIISTIQMIMYSNGDSITQRTLACPAWKDDPTYYFHTYEGMKDGINYQLVVSYSQKHKDFVIAYYPTDYTKFAESDDVDTFGYIFPDGMFYNYVGTTLSATKADDIGDGSPNRCTKTDKEMIESIRNVLKDDLDINYPDESISLYDNTAGIVIPDDTEQTKSELVFFNENKAKEGDMSGAVRNGYQATALYSLNKQQIMADPDAIDYDAYVLQYQGSIIYITDSGIMGMSLLDKYSFKEKTMDSVEVIPFEQAMDKSVEAIQENLNVADLKSSGVKLSVRNTRLMYYPSPSEDGSNEYTLIPVWATEVENVRNDPVARVIINATDGSFIKITYPVEE